MGIHKFSGGDVEIIEEFIMRVTFQKNHDITVKDLKEITGIREEALGERTYCSLVDLRKDLLTFTAEAKEFLAQNPMVNRYRVVEAILVKNFGQKMGVSFYMKIFKPKSLTRIFFDEKEAIAWLKIKYKAYAESQG